MSKKDFNALNKISTINYQKDQENNITLQSLQKIIIGLYEALDSPKNWNVGKISQQIYKQQNNHMTETITPLPKIFAQEVNTYLKHKPHKYIELLLDNGVLTTLSRKEQKTYKKIEYSLLKLALKIYLQNAKIKELEKQHEEDQELLKNMKKEKDNSKPDFYTKDYDDFNADEIVKKAVSDLLFQCNDNQQQVNLKQLSKYGLTPKSAMDFTILLSKTLGIYDEKILLNILQRLIIGSPNIVFDNKRGDNGVLTMNQNNNAYHIKLWNTTHKGYKIVKSLNDFFNENIILDKKHKGKFNE